MSDSLPPPPPPTKWAAFGSNGKLYNIETYSGYRSRALDDRGNSSILPMSANAIEIGTALRAALDASRMLPAPEIYKFMELDNLYRRGNAREVELMAFHGCTTRQTLLKRMMNVDLVQTGGKVSISSSIKRGLDAYEGDGLPPIVLPETASDEELGVAALEALARCR
jgi:CDI immunity protein